jgi:hypothetical protein
MLERAIENDHPLPRILLEIMAWKASAICGFSVLTAA